MDSSDEVESQRLTGAAQPRKEVSPLGRTGLAMACGLTHVLALALLILLSSTLKHFLSPDKPLLSWRTFPLHPFLMVLAFGFLAPIAAAAWKSYEHTLGISHRVVKIFHAVLMIAALGIGILGVADMWLVHEDSAAAQVAKGWAVHFQSAHSWVGVAALILFVLNATGGIAAFALPILRPSSRGKALEPHRLLGAAAAQQAALIAIITGDATNPPSRLALPPPPRTESLPHPTPPKHNADPGPTHIHPHPSLTSFLPSTPAQPRPSPHSAPPSPCAGILSLAWRGDNESRKDKEFKAAAIIALALCLCLGLVLRR